MLSKETLTKIAEKTAYEYKDLLEAAHKNGDAKKIARVMEDASTLIINEITDNKGMGNLSANFNSLVNIMLGSFPRFCYYFDMLHSGRNKKKGEDENGET